MRGAVQSLRRRITALAQAPRPAGSLDLVVAHRVCGCVAPRVAQSLADAVEGFSLRPGRLELDDTGKDAAARSLCLDRAARTLVLAGFVGAWRNEALEVRPEAHEPALALIDRCAVRALGITTYSVHLNGHTSDGQLMIARRAAHKRVDPGLWDNLAGGMIAAGESVRGALAREAHEEAGLQLDALAVLEGARINVHRPINDGTLAELVHVFDVDLPRGVQAHNLDGEVERFEIRSIAEVLAAIDRGEFTVEAALATLDSFERRGLG